MDCNILQHEFQKSLPFSFGWALTSRSFVIPVGCWATRVTAQPEHIPQTEGYWDELDRRQPNCLTKARLTAPPITAEHFPFRRRQRCHVSSVVAVIR
ncbi:hypothetical protein J6590_013894 [Homalodisca vitripennis]|nr:hypothetical protein J6590_013894 [Homalodisca vitripennis]